MSDNIVIPGAGQSFTEEAIDTGGGVERLVVSLGGIGKSGDDTELTAGQKTMANSIPVVIASDQDVVIDSVTVGDIEISEPLPAGTNVIGGVAIDQTTPGTTNGVEVVAELPAGTQVIGLVGIDAATGDVGFSTETTLASLLAIVGAPEDDAGDPTVIGLLKQIAANTTPPE